MAVTAAPADAMVVIATVKTAVATVIVAVVIVAMVEIVAMDVTVAMVVVVVAMAATAAMAAVVITIAAVRVKFKRVMVVKVQVELKNHHRLLRRVEPRAPTLRPIAPLLSAASYRLDLKSIGLCPVRLIGFTREFEKGRTVLVRPFSFLRRSHRVTASPLVPVAADNLRLLETTG
jgi:hypothetical protein